ncbi:ROK family protein [Pradoshia sp.]
MLLGAIEAGGTKFVCAVGHEDGTIVERTVIPTDLPEVTMRGVIQFFRKHQPDAIGIGTFGPADVDPNSPAFGTITSTPKNGWRDYPLLSELKKVFSVPMGFNTDVNAAALGEARLGVAKGLDSCMYITVGTGIGAGALIGGKLLQGLSHPEMGHIMVRRHPNDSYEGKCPYHKDCLEGLAAGPAIEARWGMKGDKLQEADEVWEMEGYYLAQAIAHYILVLSPKKIILGGGVMKQEQLFSIIARNVQEILNGYVSLPEITERLDDYLVAPGLGDNAGITGALMLAYEAYTEQNS